MSKSRTNSNINIFAYSNKGCKLAKKIHELYPSSECFTTEKLSEMHGFTPASTVCVKVGEIFPSSKLIIFIGACAIAVRAIAPHIKNKTIDPAVIVIDDCGNFVISLLSGHIGGANDIAIRIAGYLNSTPVVTTATDINNKFSVDSWAVKNELLIKSMHLAKDVSAQILDKDVAFKSDITVKGGLPDGLFCADEGELGIYVSYSTLNPFIKTLHLIPKCIHIGMGCRKNIEAYKAESLFFDVVKAHNIDLRAIKSLSSIDIKKEEMAIQSLAQKYKLDLNFYSAEELAKLSGDFTKSEFVKSITGVDNVCERAAYISSGNGRFLSKKISKDGVTVAVCAEYKEAEF